MFNRINPSKHKADADCPQCQGTGYIKSDMCPCLLRAIAIDYLGPHYRSSQWVKTFQSESVKGRNLVFSGSQDFFKSTVKSFLLNTGMAYNHMSCTGYDIVQAYLGTEQVSFNFRALMDTDYLFIYLVRDPKNRSYGEIINHILRDRLRKGKPTWLYMPDYSEAYLAQYYSADIYTFLTQNKFVSASKKSSAQG